MEKEKLSDIRLSLLITECKVPTKIYDKRTKYLINSGFGAEVAKELEQYIEQKATNSGKRRKKKKVKKNYREEE
jgi:hypothetical protein